MVKVRLIPKMGKGVLQNSILLGYDAVSLGLEVKILVLFVYYTFSQSIHGQKPQDIEFVILN
jgi:hypothetical protein